MARKRKSKSVEEQPSVPTHALITRPIDAICGGGLSLVVAIVVMIYGSVSSDKEGTILIAVSAYLFTDLLINGPHFMASYRVLYSQRSNFRNHPLVTIVAPLLAVLFLAWTAHWSLTNDASAVETQADVAVANEVASGELGSGEVVSGEANSGGVETPGQNAVGVPVVFLVLNTLAPILLGWHYVGQSWGATACFSFLSGFKMSVMHRRLIRSGFFALFAYHLAWACESMQLLEVWFPQQEAGVYMMKSVMYVTRVAVLICFGLGFAAFWMMSVEHERRVPMVVWVPWLATFSWYVMVDVCPKSFFLLQVFHALQYLLFPARVELNEYAGKRRVRAHMLVYYLLLVAVGYLVFEWSDILQWIWTPTNAKPFLFLGTATMMIVNIHHYFIDAVIWKIRKPEVRRAVFGHVESS